MLQSPLNRNGNAIDSSRYPRDLQGGGIHEKMKSLILWESKRGFTWRKNINMEGIGAHSMLQERKGSTEQEGVAWNCSMETAGGHQTVPLLSKELKGWKRPADEPEESLWSHRRIYILLSANLSVCLQQHLAKRPATRSHRYYNSDCFYGRKGSNRALQ